MSVLLSSHNLGHFEWLNFELSTHYYALCLLNDVDDADRNNEWERLLHERISVMSDTVNSLKNLENCIREGHEWNYDPDSPYCSADLASIDYFSDKRELQSDCDAGVPMTE